MCPTIPSFLSTKIAYTIVFYLHEIDLNNWSASCNYNNKTAQSYNITKSSCNPLGSMCCDVIYYYIYFI